tara:strand:- start:59 stop:1375 length:1317 start_codon:yes stop_codon:yes gene_type:complete
MIKELEILQQIESITGSGSQKAKQQLLKDNWSNTMQAFMQVAFNPFYTTKLNKLDYSESSVSTDTGELNGYKEFSDLMSTLLEAKAANNELRSEAINLVESFPPSVRKTLVDIMTKSLNIGIQAKSINKAIGENIIPTPGVMRAQDKPEEVEKWGKFYVETKYDGVRVIAKVENGKVSYWTRNFNEIPAEYMQGVTDAILELCGTTTNIFLDGELTDSNRKSVSGKLNRMLKGNPDSNISKDFIFNIFDIDSLSTLENGKGTTLYSDRRERLEDLFGENKKWNYIELAQMWICDDISKMNDIYDEIVKAGGEGVIAKKDGIYECKRSKLWIKFKEICDCDLIVTGFIPGEGRREGYVGSLECTDSTGKLQVNVGSGFTDADLEILNERIKNNELIGKVAAVRYNERITDKHGNESLFLPRFIEVRDDKTVADAIEAIK